MAKKTPPESLERDRLLRRALLLPASPRIGGYRLRPFSLWTLDLCEEIGLDFFVRLPDGVPRAGGTGYQLAALVWFHDAARSVDEIDEALLSGEWREAVRALSRDPALEAALPAISDYVAFFASLIAATSVRVRKKPRAKGAKEEKEPADLLEPGQAFSLVWSIAGGSIEGPDQFRALYRETPLPVILSFYHCALRAALLWTVAPRRGVKAARPVASKEKAAAALAAVIAKSKASVGDGF